MVALISTDEYVRAFVDLGLTGLQARSYITLLEAGPLTVGQLAIISKTDRPNTYRATIELLQLGLVEKVITNPVEYKPIPFANAVSILWEQQKKKREELMATLGKLAKGLEGNHKDAALTDDHQFVLIPRGQQSELKMVRLFESSKESVISITPRKRVIQWVYSNHEMILREAKKHEIKIITEQSKQPWPSRLQEILKIPNFQVRYSKETSAVWFRVYDSRELLMETSINPAQEAQVIWSNNPCLVGLALQYFHMLWENPELEKTTA